jgi:hypothetical protein
LLLAIHGESKTTKTEMHGLDLYSTPSQVDILKQHFTSLDEASRVKFFSDFIDHLGKQDKSLSTLIGITFSTTQYMVMSVFGFNTITAICLIYLLIKDKRPDQKSVAV